uniref:FLYWCH-type domain-containing protein n=1 Tax=Caenorhabditis tropicalis TaxID=1561998 RepID=A0A1I7SXD7_9PELO
MSLLTLASQQTYSENRIVINEEEGGTVSTRSTWKQDNDWRLKSKHVIDCKRRILSCCNHQIKVTRRNDMFGNTYPFPRVEIHVGIPP